MGTGAFLRQSHLATVDRFVSASSEAGITTQQPQPATTNAGSLRLSASGVPTAALGATLRLQRGGLPLGFYLAHNSTLNLTPGAALTWLLDGDTASQYRGHTQHSMLTYARTMAIASAVTDFPRVSEVRTLGNGSMGCLFTRVAVGSDSLRFAYKATRTASWTIVTITSTGVDTFGKPALVVLPTGRLLAYFYTTAAACEAWYSDDNGLTWAVFSTDTRVTFDAADGNLQAESAGDLVCVVTSGSPDSPGTNVRLHWSIDGGATFAYAGEVGTSAGVARTCVTASGVVLVFVSETTSCSLYVAAPGGGVGTGRTIAILYAAQPVFCCSTSDDGSIWLFSESSYAPASRLNAYVSPDGGLNWYEPGADIGTTVFDNRTGASGGTSYGFDDVTIGAWGGSLIMIGITDGATAAYDNSLMEMWWGGWDSITEDPKVSADTAVNCDYYAKGVYIAQDEPAALGEWAATASGVGATITVTNDGLRMVASAAGNTYYQASTEIWNPAAGDSVRLRFIYRVISGGDVASDVCTLQLSCSDATNRQWLTLRFTPTNIRAIDNSGTLATTASVVDQFADHTELLVAFDHDNTAGQGLASVYYRKLGADHWTALLSNQVVAELGASATEYIRFGGTANADATWDISLVAVADGAGNLHDGFTNPTDLAGRGLSASVPFYVHRGVKVAAYGGPGVQGDTYDCDTAYSFGGRNVWLSSRPSQHWRSAVDQAATNIVHGDAANHYRADTAILVGTNVPTMTLQFSETDSWGSPTFTATLSAVVWQGTASSVDDGYLKVDGEPFVPHRFRSSPGHRWYVELNPGAGADIFEITDNESNALMIEDLATSYAGSTIRIFSDRMGAVFPVQYSSFVRLLTGTDDTAEGYFRVGAFFIGSRHSLAVQPYDTGYVDRWVANAEVYTADTGYDSAAVIGPEKHELRIAWGPIDRMSSTAMADLVALFRSLDGNAKPVAFWRDLEDPSTIGIYRVTGPVVRENMYGEGADELARMAQLVLTELTP